MERKPPKPQTPFDNLVIPQQLQMMKLLLPYISSGQGMLAIFIKFSELQHTIQYVQNPRSILRMQAFEKKKLSFTEMLEEFIPYLDKEQGDMIHNILNALQMMEMFQSFSDLMPNMSGSEPGGFSPESLMKNMFSPEQQEMFDFYSNMFSQGTQSAYDSNESNEKKEETYGKMDESSRFEESRSDQAGTDTESLSADIREERQRSGSDSDGTDLRS